MVGKSKHARNYFTQALRIEERSDFYILLGSAYMRLNENQAAETSLRKAIETERSNEEAMYNLAEVIRCSRKETGPAEALELYKKVIEIDPRDANAHRGMADIFITSQRYEEAEAYVRTALTFDPDN